MTDTLQEKVSALAAEHEVAGVAVGVLLDGEEHYAFHGVTSVENPLPVDEKTLFQFGSTGKTYTAAAMLRLVEQGRVDLDAPVRTYLPDFIMRDTDVAEKVTVLQLFNHTAGWEGDMMDDTGAGDDALARYVEKMRDLEQVSPLGATVSYNNASLSLAGHIIATVTGTTYEQAIRDLLLDPLGLKETFFFANEIAIRRFTVGHTRHEDGRVTIDSPWQIARGNAPAGGMSATARDQIAWARFHLGDGTAPDGTRLLQKATLEKMREPTASMVGSALGDHVGISWLLRDVDGVRLVTHGGTTHGQHSEFLMVPERNFAIISMTNSGPNGPQLNNELGRWALEHYLGVVDAEPVPVELSEEAAREYVGTYETIAASCEITAGDGRLQIAVTMKPETLAKYKAAGQETADEEQPPLPIAPVSGEGDRYVVTDGPAKGMKGYFSRGADGKIDGVHVGGRLATRVLVPA